MRRFDHDETTPRRKPGALLRRAYEQAAAEAVNHAGLRRERGLSVRHYRPDELGSVPVPRPHAGKKSRRTHARTWG